MPDAPDQYLGELYSFIFQTRERISNLRSELTDTELAMGKLNYLYLELTSEELFLINTQLFVILGVVSRIDNNTLESATNSGVTATNTYEILQNTE